MSLWLKVRNRLRRDLSVACGQRPWQCAARQPIVSFTFDDFPRSALHRGGAILREQNLFGTYYAAFGLMGRTIATGEIFTRDDCAEFVRQGHELGCHTFDHCDAWETAPAEFEASILRNRRAAAELFPGARLLTCSYPINVPRPATKMRTGKYYAGCRGGWQTFNCGPADLNNLKAFFIEQSRDDLDAIKRVIDENARRRGWLIFATHDISDTPTRFGCAPDLLKQILRHTAQSGARVLPVAAALREIDGSADEALQQAA